MNTFNKMVCSKYAAVNFCIFLTCLTTFLMLFSLDNKKTTRFSKYSRSISRPPDTSFKLFNLDFKYLLNNKEVCKNDDITAIIIVTSYYGNIETRSAMRRSFSNEHLKQMKLRRVFLLAVGPQNNKFDVDYKAILNENQRFEDLIQGNFNEAYRNLTYKHVMGLKWASTYCKNAKFIIKMDDDAVINMHKLLPLLKNLTLSNNNQLLAGYVLRGMVPIREPANKWFVTKQEYFTSMYPPFLSGWFYITTPKVADKLVGLSHRTPYFWIDDVYVTGILAKKLKLSHYNLNKIFAVHSEYLQCCIRDLKKYKYDCDFIVGTNGGDNNLFYIFNSVMEKCLYDCIPKPVEKTLNNSCVAERKILVGKGKALIETVHLF